MSTTGGVGLAVARLGLVAIVIAGERLAAADHFEAAFDVQPIAAVANAREPGAAATNVGGGGLQLGLAWGVRNWLDVGGAVVAETFATAHYDPATETVTGSTRVGALTRTSRLGQVRLGATLRLGVAWVPTVYVGFGAGARLRSPASFSPNNESTTLTIDGGEATTTIDVVAVTRIGLDHRFGVHWSFGLGAGAVHCFPLGGAPALDVLELTASLNYRWYPLW